MLLTPGFPRQGWYGQRAFAHSLLWVERPDSLRESRTAKPVQGAVRSLEVPLPPMYFVVICGGLNATLPKLAALSALVRSHNGTRLVSTEGLFWFRGIA